MSEECELDKSSSGESGTDVEKCDSSNSKKENIEEDCERISLVLICGAVVFGSIVGIFLGWVTGLSIY